MLKVKDAHTLAALAVKHQNPTHLCYFTIPFLIDGGATHPILIRTVKFKKNYQHTVCMTDGNTIDPFHNFLIPNFDYGYDFWLGNNSPVTNFHVGGPQTHMFSKYFNYSKRDIDSIKTIIVKHSLEWKELDHES